MSRKKVSGPICDPNLDEVGEDRAVEILLDEVNREVVFLHHYRRKWGDQFDADIEHGYDLDKTNKMILVLMSMVEKLTLNVIEAHGLIEKRTPEPIEGNPAQGPLYHEGK